MFKIIFNQNPENTFHNFHSSCLDKLKQIIVETNLSAQIMDTTTGELVFEFTSINGQEE